jgi:Leucine-rich repeat (LRR) protein
MITKSITLLITSIICFCGYLKSQTITDTLLLTDIQLKKAKIYTNFNSALLEPEKVIILDLTGQNLDSLPSTIGLFINLQILKLGWKIKDNTPKSLIRKAKKVGGGIMHFDRLQGIYVDYNHLQELPTSITNLRKLQIINLSYNDIFDVPFDLSHLKNLKMINLIGCYSLLDKVDDLKKFKSLLPTDCLLYCDVRF